MISTMNAMIKLGFAALLGFLLITAVSLLFTVPVYLLWNWLMPVLFGLKEITLFQSYGLYLFCAILLMSGQTKLTFNK